MIVTYEDFKNAIELFEITNRIDRKTVKDKYILFAKLYHPDKNSGNKNKFQDINRAYKIIMQYIDNYRFEFSEEEFKKQYPFGDEKDWLSSM